MKLTEFFIIPIICLAIGFFGLFLVACGQESTPDQVQDPQLSTSEKQRVMAPAATTAEVDTLVTGNNAFAFDLYQNLRDEEGNLFYSPFSISQALSMTWAGARGDTAQEMSEVFHFTQDSNIHHQAFNALDLALISRGEGSVSTEGEPFRLHIANSLWGQESYSFILNFLDLLAENYGAGMHILDFFGDTENSRVTINNWVEEETEDKIQDLLAAGTITPMTRLVLVNAIYFNAAWSNTFAEELTFDQDFTLANGDTQSVPMMHQTETMNYTEEDDFQAVEMLYDGEELGMVFLLPAVDQFDSFESTLSGTRVQQIIDSLAPTEVKLAMPKFELKQDFNLNDSLIEMGMPLAFDNGLADFTGMEESGELYISAVVHQAFVSVDEKGTEAAAATAVVMSGNGMPVELPEVTLDRPFIFFIHDIETGTILFIGRVNNPISE